MGREVRGSRLAGLLLLAAVTSVSVAGEARGSSEFEGNIHRGNVAVSGYVDLNRRSGAGASATEYDFGTSSAYFVADFFAVGLKAAVSGASDSDTGALLGPTVAYYFWQEKSLASFVRASVQFGLTDATIKSLLRGELGLEHFLTPSVAVGPVVSYTHYDSRLVDYQRLGFSVNFSIYL